MRVALDILAKSGIDAVKIVPLAKKLGVTSGSFYWHFSNRSALYEALLEYWEREMTDKAIDTAKNWRGSAKSRIWQLMEQVMDSGMARFDLAIWHWAQTDPEVHKVFTRTVERRFKFAAWMFEEAGFDPIQAEVRGRMMVVYMMGESTLLPGESQERRRLLTLKHEILTANSD